MSASKAAAAKIDFKKEQKALYRPSAKEIVKVRVPKMNFVMFDGAGSPAGECYATAMSWLYSISYGIKFYSKLTLEKDYVVPPLEGLWWADDMSAFTEQRKDEWFWRSMIRVPDWIKKSVYLEQVKKASKKLGDAPETLRFEAFDEGECVQVLHVGPYGDQGPLVEQIHKTFLPEHGLIENGEHHEIYLNDPRRSDPAKLKTVLRQPVRALKETN